MSEPVEVRTFVHRLPFESDMPEDFAREIALEGARLLVVEQAPGWVEVSYSQEVVRALIPGTTVWGWDEHGKPIGSPEDYAITTHIRGGVLA